MRILVVGAGSIGRRHIGNLNSLGYPDIDVADPDAAALEHVKKTLNVRKTYRDYEDALAQEDYDIGFVLTPPAHHIPIASRLADEGIDLFIEKPLSSGLSGVDAVIKKKKKNRLVVMVGYNQRFNKGIQELKSALDSGLIGRPLYIRAEFGQNLADWRPSQDYRKGYSAKKNLGGGILLDASHELDYVLWLAKAKVADSYVATDKVSDLDIDVEDTAEIFLRFSSGCVGSIHTDMVEKGYNRYCKVVGEKGTIKWTFKPGVLEINSDKKSYELDPNHSYVEELRHFLNCIEDRKEPETNLESSKKVLEVLLKSRGRRWSRR